MVSRSNRFLSRRRNSRADGPLRARLGLEQGPDHDRVVGQGLDPEHLDRPVELDAPDRVGGELRRLVPDHRQGPVHDPRCSGTLMSTTARDQPRVLLLTTLISPFGMMCMRPVEIAQDHHPERHPLDHAALPAASITSPTANWFSTRMKKPEMTSLTRLWAPKETARPRMPAPARIGRDVDEDVEREQDGDA